MQDHRELSRHRNACTRHAAALGDLHAPGAQARPFAAADKQRVRRLIEGGPGKLVAAPAHLALDVGLAGLVARRRQAQMCGRHRAIA